MCPVLPRPFLIPCLALAGSLAACFDGPQTPGSRSEPPAGEDTGIQRPLDLVYVCGNRFLATNSTPSALEIGYRVVGTGETGSLMLDGGTGEDPGYTETELETSTKGIVELIEDDHVVVRRRNEGWPCGASAVSAGVSVGAGAESGEWSAPFSWPGVAVHLSLLPDGKVLSWGLSRTTHIWNSATGSFSAATSPALVYCSGHSLLADGRLLVSGGHISADHGIPDNTIFSAPLQRWALSAPMRRGRWYPTNTTLANGDVVILAGADEAGAIVTEPEVWSPAGVRVLGGASRSFPYYPRTFLAPNGRIFYAGAQQTSRYLNTAGSGSWTTVGGRRYGFRDYGAAVMYDDGKILYAGGGRTTATAEIIDLNSAAPAWQWTGSMTFPRRNHNATVLPTGEVLVTGGSSATTSQDVARAVRAAELWDPSTGRWRLLASNTIRRTYHSTTILLPDGRVLHAGSGDADGMPNERNAELFSPPYLFKGARPVIIAAPTAVPYGSTFTVMTAEAGTIARISLVRLGSVTHSFDMNQRFQRLSFTRANGALTVVGPGNRNRTPPGHYMLFILNGNGVPSVSKIVRIGGTPEVGPPGNASPSAGFTSSCTSLACTFTDRSTDSDGTIAAWRWSFGDGGTSTDRSPTRTYATPGTYTVTLTVTDNSGGTNQRSAPVTVASGSSNIVLTATGRTEGGVQYMSLKWTGATGTMVDIYRSGVRIRTTANDGSDTNGRTFQGPATYVFRVCQAGTSVCSNDATVVFN